MSSININFDGRGSSISNSPFTVGNNNNINFSQAPRSADQPQKRSPLRIFLSHTSELRKYPKGGSYIDRAEEAIIACGHVPVSMKHFPAVDESAVCYDTRRVKECDVYIGVYGCRWGSAIPNDDSISHTEQEFNTASENKIRRLIFILDLYSSEHNLPLEALDDAINGDKQQLFLARVLKSGLIAQYYRNPDDLKLLIERSLREMGNEAKETS